MGNMQCSWSPVLLWTWSLWLDCNVKQKSFDDLFSNFFHVNGRFDTLNMDSSIPKVLQSSVVYHFKCPGCLLIITDKAVCKCCLLSVLRNHPRRPSNVVYQHLTSCNEFKHVTVMKLRLSCVWRKLLWVQHSKTQEINTGTFYFLK